MVTSIDFDIDGIAKYEGCKVTIYPADGGKQLDIYLTFADGSQIPFPFDEIRLGKLLVKDIPTPITN